jgi:hypothetical protein|uniref:Class I SAM-dependent methyltransferase n=1 Tax=Desulfobacca acetoxidans TaxID=60893 RepID=A0A7C3SKK1_9BACT
MRPALVRPGLEDLTHCWSASGFAQRRRFEEAARRFIRLPQAGEGPLAYLWPEAVWRELLATVSDPEGWLMALSTATGVYFFPSREWPRRYVQFLKRLKVRRLLEAGAGRGYLSAALASLTAAAGIVFKAIDKGEGEFQGGLPTHEIVEVGDIFRVIHEFMPEVVLYAWPPPGQSLATLWQSPSLRYLMVIGVKGGGVTGAPADWDILPHKPSPALSRFGRGRSSLSHQQATIFWRPRHWAPY